MILIFNLTKVKSLNWFKPIFKYENTFEIIRRKNDPV